MENGMFYIPVTSLPLFFVPSRINNTLYLVLERKSKTLGGRLVLMQPPPQAGTEITFPVAQIPLGQQEI